jgi:endonuclease G
MALSRNHRFGLITFLGLIIAAVLVTLEPWKGRVEPPEASLAVITPPIVRIEWESAAAGYPETALADTIRTYSGFDLAYNEEFEQASWVAYILTRGEVEQGTVPRSDDFRPDTTIRTGSAGLSDYRNSGFDRGHLAPAGDMKWSFQAMSESFLLSNISPQEPYFNRGIWRRLEQQVREWAVEKDSIYVVTGPVLSNVTTRIGTNEVGVPSYYFKVLADLSPPDHSFIAFLLPNQQLQGVPLQYAISVDSLEQFTGYDFFASAPDPEMIEWMEGRLDFSEWNTTRNR